MPNPLLELDGKRKYLFSKEGGNFYLKVIVSAQEAGKEIYRDAFRSLDSITFDSEEQLSKEIQEKGHVIKSRKPKPKEDAIEEQIKKRPEEFGTDSNQTMFVLENEKGEFVSVILVKINDPETRKDLNVSEDVGTFIYVSDISTSERYRGQNLFSGAFDKVVTMLANPATGLKSPIKYSVSMTATTAVRNDGEEFEYVRNLPRYAEMWQQRFTENKLQDRFRIEGRLVGRDRRSLEDFLNNSDHRKVDESKVNELIQTLRTKAESCGESVRGLYLEGESPEYLKAKEERKELLSGREKKGITKKQKTKWLTGPAREEEDKEQGGDSAAPSATEITGVSVKAIANRGYSRKK